MAAEKFRSAYSTLYREAQQAVSSIEGGNPAGALKALLRGLGLPPRESLHDAD